MRVNYRIEETDSGTVISVFDDIDLANANLLADTLFSLIDTRGGVVVDLRGLRYIDSVGLHILLRAAQRAQRIGCEVSLVAVRPIRQLVEQVGLDRLMPIIADAPAPPHAAKKPAAGPPRSPVPPAVVPPSVAPSSAAPPVSARGERPVGTPKPAPVKSTDPSRTAR